MALEPGTSLGTFRITGPLGKGGMGEVYRATDTKLDREVAIKTLPATLADDADRLARFEREAKLLAALNHANIASVYNLDEHDDTLYIAMELVEGETLEQKIAGGRLPVETALELALQIAQALEAAHESGVVHRDLKPANIMITPNGVVKVLDFGLAKAFSGDPNDASPAHSPALSVAMTQQGLILGTAGYMSPEQASGQATDQRADVWAFGVVVYEMLTGQPLFRGESVPHVLAAVLQLEPDWSRLPENLQPRIRFMLERCLTKKPRDRYAGIADARADVEAVLADPAGTLAPARPGTDARRRPSAVGLAAAGLAGAVVVALAGWLFVLRESPETADIIRFEHRLPVDRNLDVSRPALDISPDGRMIAYVTEEGLQLLSLGEFAPRPLATPDDGLSNPTFSPDGAWIAYHSDGADQIQKIPTTGGAPVVIADQQSRPIGMNWGPDDRILYSDNGNVMAVSANGGTPEPILPAAMERAAVFPEMLPDASGVLFSIGSATTLTAGDGQIGFFRFGADEAEVLFGDAGGAPHYVASGHIVYESSGALFARPFDAETLEYGGPVPLVEPVHFMAIALSPAGTLAYGQGAASSSDRALVWVDRNGDETAIDAPPRAYLSPRISPDGTTLALDVRDDSSDIYTFSLERNILTRLTFDASADRVPVWSPDGQRIVYTNGTGQESALFSVPANGGGEPEPLIGSAEALGPFASDFPDDNLIVYTAAKEDGDRDIETLSIQDETRITSLISTPFIERNGIVSPDGRWIAYDSNESGDFEVYVRPFPDSSAGGRWQISRGGGTRPLWRANGEELFYLIGPGRVMAVPVDDEDTFSFGDAAEIVNGPYLADNIYRTYDVSADGQRFLMVKSAGENPDDPEGASQPPRINVVVNWIEELKERVAVE